jgi:hypothetical protein
MPIAHQWDDHDAGGNNIDLTYPRWYMAQRVFQEYVPTYALPSVSIGIWQQFSHGHADFFILDCRSHRNPETDPDPQGKSMLDGRHLGARGQLEWFKTSLRESTAKWKIVFSSVPTNPTCKPNDSWGAYQSEWNGLRSFIETNGIQNVVFISGDAHLGAIDNGNASGFPELSVPQPNGQSGCPSGPEGTWSEGFVGGLCRGYGLVSVRTNPDRLVLEVKDENGITQRSYLVPDNSTGVP